METKGSIPREAWITWCSVAQWIVTPETFSSALYLEILQPWVSPSQSFCSRGKQTSADLLNTANTALPFYVPNCASKPLLLSVSSAVRFPRVYCVGVYKIALVPGKRVRRTATPYAPLSYDCTSQSNVGKCYPEGNLNRAAKAADSVYVSLKSQICVGSNCQAKQKLHSCRQYLLVPTGSSGNKL